jgi:hypothetical protein
MPNSGDRHSVNQPECFTWLAVEPRPTLADIGRVAAGVRW